MEDAFKRWHDFQKTYNEGIESGKIKVSIELTDYDLAIMYVIGIAKELGYDLLTTEMIWHLACALTDVDMEE